MGFEPTENFLKPPPVFKTGTINQAPSRFQMCFSTPPIGLEPVSSGSLPTELHAVSRTSALMLRRSVLFR